MNSWPEKLQIQLMDSKGQAMKVFQPGMKLKGTAYKFNISELPNGVYFLKLVDSGFTKVKKIVIN